MPKSAAAQWGPCPCGGTYLQKMVEVRMTAAGTTGELLDMPQGTCQLCGARVYKAEGLARIEGTMKREPLDRLLSRPVV
jgi:hypothetical protein